MEGIILTREYFSGQNADETEIRKLADSLWRGVEWTGLHRRRMDAPS